MRDVAVIGAGPAGLTAANRLAERGFDVTIVERSDRVGGLTASFDVAGQSVDFGSHRLHPSTPAEVMELLARLMGPELQRRERNGRIRLGDRWLPFPLESVATVRALTPRFLVEAVRDAIGATFRRRSTETFADYVETGLGRAMGEHFYFPYVTKIWGLEPSLISGEQARRRISADTPAKLVARVLRSGEGGAGFYYPAGGFGRIAETLAGAAVEAGADIRLESAVEQIEPLDGGWRVIAAGEEIPARRVWSTIPLPALAAVTDGAPSTPSLEYRSMVLVYLAVSGKRYSPFDAHYLPSPETPVTRISEPKNYRDGDDPPDRTVLCFEIPCARSDRVWQASDGELTSLALTSLARSGLEVPQILETHAERVPAAYPVYRVGFESALAPLLEWVDETPGLLTLGRQGLFAHDNTHHAMSMAISAVDCLGDDGSFDAGRWRDAMASFARHRVED